MIQVIVFEEICTVPFGLLGRLLEKVLHIGTHGFALHRFTAGKPEVTAEMVSGAEPLFDQRQLPRGIQTAAETAFHIIPVLVFAVAGFQLRAKRIGRSHHAVFSGRRRAVNGQIVGTDHLGREQLGQQRHPSLPEMEGERLFCMGSTVKAQIFPEGCPYCLCQFLAAQCAGAGKRRRQTFFPRRQHRRLLSEHSFPAGGLKRVYQLVFRHPLLSGKLVFRGKKGSGMRLPQSRQRGALRQLFFVDGIFQCQPCQIVIHGLMSVTRPRGKQLF